jgi:hypothetical protein
MHSIHKTSDLDIFTTLKEEVIEVCTLLLVMRDFASEKGLKEEIEKIDSNIAENNDILLLLNDLISELTKNEITKRIGLFDTFWAA